MESTTKAMMSIHKEDLANVSSAFRFSGIIKNLVNDFDTTDSDICSQEQLYVFLRIRPIDKENCLESCYTIENQHKITTVAPKSSNAFKSNARHNDNVRQQYTFSKIFSPGMDQSTIFSECVLETVREFIEGQNSLVFTYGTTSSGKTYTMQGTATNIGIIPRTFDVLFNSVTQKENASVMPSEFCSTTNLDLNETAQVQAEKSNLLKLAGTISETICKPMSSKSTTTNISSDTAEMNDLAHLLSNLDNREHETTSLNVESVKNMRFAFWVSFAEIYNEAIYDLLDPASTQVPGKSQKLFKRPALSLKMDKKAGIYIKGLRCIPVSSADEAYRMLLVGKANQQVASTHLNVSSSRSHTVFNIIAVRSVDKENPRFSRVSQLTFCDLAGSERTVKAAYQPAGQRFKEATNINTSLMTLGRCIELMRYNQTHRNNPKIVPYRDSKLTRLLQSFFCGKGRGRMIATVNPSPDLFDETQHALKFSAIAQQIVLPEVPPEKKCYQQLGLNPPSEQNDRISIAWETPRSKSIRQSQLLYESMQDDDDLKSETATVKKSTTGQLSRLELVTIINDLRDQIEELKKEMIDKEWKARIEVSNELTAQMSDMENRYENEMRELEQTMKEESDRRIKLYVNSYRQIHSRKRRKVGKRGSKDEEEIFDESNGEDEKQSQIDALNKKHADAMAECKKRMTAMEEELAEQKDAIDSLQEINDELLLENNKMKFVCEQQTHKLEALHNETPSAPGTANMVRYNDSCVSFCIPQSPVTVKKKNYFAPMIPKENVSSSSSNIEKTISLNDLKEENQHLVRQMNELMTNLNREMQARKAAELDSTRLKNEMEHLQSTTMFKSMQNITNDESFLAHEKQIEKEESLKNKYFK